MIDEATRTYVMVAPFIKPGAEYPGPLTYMYRLVFWSAMGGMDLDLDTMIESHGSWLNKPEYTVERANHVSACEFLKAKAYGQAD
jgi:hypothetical protein